MADSNTNNGPAPPTTEIAKMNIENGTATPEKKEAPPATPAPTPGAFKESFKAFSKFGDTKSDGKHITLSQSDKWMKQAKVIDGKKITTTDTGIYFKKLKQMKVTAADYQKFLEDLAKNKKIEVDEIKNKMASCSQPGLHGVGVNIILLLIFTLYFNLKKKQSNKLCRYKNCSLKLSTYIIIYFLINLVIYKQNFILIVLKKLY